MWKRREFLTGLGSAAAARPASALRRNLLLIVVDGQRSEMMGCAGNRQPLGELYDLRNDPDEFDNLWNDPGRRRLREERRDRLLERILAAADPAPIRKYNA